LPEWRGEQVILVGRMEIEEMPGFALYFSPLSVKKKKKGTPELGFV